MENPFDVILEHLRRIEERLQLSPPATETTPEIIDRAELCKRFGVTEQTAIRWERRGKIPALRIGAAVRYNFPKVIETLEKKT